MGLADAAIAAGAVRLTNLTATLETALADDLGGRKIRSVQGWGNVIGTVGGAQDFTYALFVGPSLLDAADVFPFTQYGDNPWWTWNTLNHRGQQHNVLAAASEFTEHRVHLRTRSPRRLPMTGSNLWFVEEAAGQTQNAKWTFVARVDA